MTNPTWGMLNEIEIQNIELRAEVERLQETIAEWQEIHGTFTGDVHAACQAEIERLRTAVLAYDDAIRDVAGLGARWVRDDDKLDDLYAEMICAAGRDINA